MNFRRRTIRIWLIVGIATCALTIGVTRLTDAFHVRSVTYNGNEVDNFAKRFGMRDSASVFQQPVDSVAGELLKKRSVYRVDIDIKMPDVVDIRTNNFVPVCYVIDSTSGELYGLTNDARVIGLETAVCNWEHPVICGVRIAGLYKRCPDYRVALVIDELRELEERNTDLYRLIDEVDLSSGDHARVSLGGMPYHLRVRPERIASDIIRIADFISNYRREIDSVNVIDLRFDDMIVTSRGRM